MRDLTYQERSLIQERLELPNEWPSGPSGHAEKVLDESVERIWATRGAGTDRFNGRGTMVLEVLGLGRDTPVREVQDALREALGLKRRSS